MHEPEPQRQCSGQLDRAERERERGVLGRLLYSTLCRSHWGRAIRSGRVELSRGTSELALLLERPQLCGKLCCKLSMENKKKKKKKIRDTGVVRGEGGRNDYAPVFSAAFVYTIAGYQVLPHPLPIPQLRVHCAQSTAKACLHSAPSCAVQWRRRSS